MKTRNIAPILLVSALLCPLFAANGPSPGRGLQSVREAVRGDSGKWNDAPILQVIPPLSNKPRGTDLDTWGDQQLGTPVSPKADEEVWLLFRTRQLDDNDRVWVESIETKGKTVTVTMREAIWQGNYQKTFTYYGVLAVNLGKLPPGDYLVKWVVEPFIFDKFDGDGRPTARKDRSPNWPVDLVKWKDEAKVIEREFAVE